MRLRFNNKRRRNGNQVCTYEAFKPTRFNLYAKSDEPLWCTIRKNDSLESSSPTVKKKSVTVKLNPVVGARLARNESPARSTNYTVTQKYDDKIRMLQQQRQKERIRRRNHSARAADNFIYSRGENVDGMHNRDAHTLCYSDFRLKQTASMPSPAFYVISDEDDSVAIQLGDVDLESSKLKNDEKLNKYGPTIDNDYEKLRNNNEITAQKQNGILERLQSHKRVLQSYSISYDNGSQSPDSEVLDAPPEIHNYNELSKDCESGDKLKTAEGSYKKAVHHVRSQSTSNSTDSKMISCESRAISPVTVTYAGQRENGFFNRSRTSERQYAKKLEGKENVENVFIKSKEIRKPLIIKNEAGSKISSKEPPLVQYEGETREDRGQDGNTSTIKNIHEQSLDSCDERNYYEIKMLITDLDDAYATTPLSRNSRYAVCQGENFRIFLFYNSSLLSML